jgi:hypothetical protein
MTGEDVKRLWNIIIIALAAVYFLLDALFAMIAIPLARWIAGHWMFARLHRWVLSLGPYPTLLLFLVPLVILEPVKPVAAYLATTHHVWLGLALLSVGEILKLVLVERLFHISRDKLLTIRAFAWAYSKYVIARDWLTSLDAWQRVRRWSRLARLAVRRHARGLRGSDASRAMFQSY